MKSVISRSLAFGLAGFGMFGGTAPVASASDATLVPVSAQYLFVPKGFDDNDSIEVVVDGYLPSTCYKQTEPKITVDELARTVTVQPMALLFQGICLDVLVPFTEVARVGILSTGEYRVSTPSNTEQLMQVARSTNAGPDDNLYAPVDSVHVTVEPENQKIYAEIDGRYTNTCMAWEKATVIDTSDTIQLLPIIKMNESPDCQELEFPFKIVKVELPWRGPGRYLLHTRGLNGKATNAVFSVYGER